MNAMQIAFKKSRELVIISMCPIVDTHQRVEIMIVLRISVVLDDASWITGVINGNFGILQIMKQVISQVVSSSK